MTFLISAVVVIATYFIFLYQFTLKISNDKYVHEIKYNGLLWVALDYWSIKKYKSDDLCMKWIEHNYAIKK